MERMNKIMVIDYSVPKNDKDANNLLEYFAIPGTPDENAERMKETSLDFLKQRDTDDVATWFLKMFEDGRISPSEVLMFAVAAWARPLVEAQEAQKTFGDELIQALKDGLRD